MSIKRFFGSILLVGFMLAWALSAWAQDVDQLLKEKKYKEAIAAYEEMLEENPYDDTILYNMACAYSLWNKKKQAVEYLTKAIDAGFANFDHIEADEDFKNIRRYYGYKKLMRRKKELAKEAAVKRFANLKKKYGDAYAYEMDKKRKLIYVVKVSEGSLMDSIKTCLNDFTDALRQYIFTIEPDCFLTILCLTQQDFNRKVGRPEIAGFYDYGSRTLTCRNTGHILKHEFTHALHYADFIPRGQRYTMWMGEGLATCFEESKVTGSKIVSLYSYRIDMAKKLIENGHSVPWRTFMKLGVGGFQSSAAQHYAQSRSIFYWLDHTGKLKAFYKAHAKLSKKSPFGIKSMEATFNKKLEDIEKMWKAWILKAKPDTKVVENKSGTRLGVWIESSVAGMVLKDVESKSAADKAGLKIGDIVVKIGSDKITTYEEFQNAIRKRRPGQRVTFHIIRDGKNKRIRVTMGKV